MNVHLLLWEWSNLEGRKNELIECSWTIKSRDLSVWKSPLLMLLGSSWQMIGKGPDYSLRKSHPQNNHANLTLPRYSYWLPCGIRAALPTALIKGTTSCTSKGHTVSCPLTVFSVILLAPITVLCGETKHKPKPLFLGFLGSWYFSVSFQGTWPQGRILGQQAGIYPIFNNTHFTKRTSLFSRILFVGGYSLTNTVTACKCIE